MNGKQVRIAPSILSADFAALGAAIAAAEKGGADLIHVDVMDGHFVPNITIGPPVVKSIKRVARVPLDVHLMITDPDKYAEAFVEAGADMLSVHVEVLPHLHRSVDVHQEPWRQGRRRAQPVDARRRARGNRRRRRLHSGDVGQSRLRRPEIHSEEPARKSPLFARCSTAPAIRQAPIEIDGGIDLSNIARAVEAGVEIVVAGSAIFNTPDPTAATKALKDAAAAVAS